MKNQMNGRTWFFLILMIIGFIFLGQLWGPGGGNAEKEKITFDQLHQMVQENPQQIQKLVFVNGANEVIVERKDKEPVRVPVPAESKELLVTKAANAKIAIEAVDSSGGLLVALISWLPMILMIFIFIWIFKGMSQAGQQMQQRMSQSRAKKFDGSAEKKTFKDVAGCDEAKEELEEIVSYLKHPGVLGHLGGRAPRGVMLVGPPGTGKTLLAKAVAGEAGVPFLSVSGSEFVEMFVGVGASRVRGLFDDARKNSPCILFIDEIDAVGRQRGTGLGGGHDEREQTLNQILVEMDGFGSDTGIIMMAATNRPDVLDPALMRPGRFDRQVMVDAPDVDGREAIFKIHTRDKKLDAGVDLRHLATRTPGFTGAEIEGACNEAAAVAARRILKEMARLRQANNMSEAEINAQLPRVITLEDFDEGIDRLQMGPARTSRAAIMTEQDKKNTSIHELGHALLTELLEGGDPVTKITIMPRARALGFTQALPEGDRYNYTDKQLLARIIMAMGGRAAQEMLLQTVDTGASNDFHQAENMARRMVTEFGMSKLGPISVQHDNASPFLGRAMAMPADVGPELANRIDAEVRCITQQCLDRARELCTEYKDFILKANEVLMDKETILAPEWRQLLADSGIESHKLPANVDCTEAGLKECGECGSRSCS